MFAENASAFSPGQIEHPSKAATPPAPSLHQDGQAKGTAKFAASVYETKTGKLTVSTDPVWGFSRTRDGRSSSPGAATTRGVDFDKNRRG